ncbi:hypothetical protein ACJMK2_025031 [Sinanodonta woodiana]|uniref:Uncharacterized protein n=1 Tax=Sinanodonta woodiana TaxID=1069815 RepID=A0ABD3XIU0_SINWO
MKILRCFAQAIIILAIYNTDSCVEMQHISASNTENIIIQIGERLYLALPVDGTEKTYLLPIQIGVAADTSTIIPEPTSESQEKMLMKWTSDQVENGSSAEIKQPSNEGSQSRGSTVKDNNLVNRSTILREILLPNWNTLSGQHFSNANDLNVNADVKSIDARATVSTRNNDNGQSKSEESLLLIAKGKQFKSSYMRHDLRLPHALRGIVRISPDMKERILKNNLERTIAKNNVSDADNEGSHNFTTSSGHFTISKVKTPEGHWHIAIKSETENGTISNKTELATPSHNTEINNSSISSKGG